MLLAERLAAVAERHPERPAIYTRAETLSYLELVCRARVLAVRFQELGVGSGDRVAVLSENRIEAIVTFWAALEIGAIAVVLNRRLEPDELREILADCEPRVLATTAKLTEGLSLPPLNPPEGLSLPPLNPPEGTLGNISARICDFDDADGPFGDLSGDAVPTPWDGGEDEPAVIIYTSGSSGKAKGVCLSHRNLWTVMKTVISQTGLTEEDTYLLVVPLHYVHGIMQLFSHHFAGAALHLAGDFIFPGQIVRRLEREEITGFSGVPLHFSQLIENGGFLKADLPKLRWVTITGGKCPPEHLRRILEAKPELEIYIAYGQTECAPRATLLDPARLHRKLDSVGAPIPGVEVKILDPDGSELPQGEVGEVVVAGENIMLGYWRDPELTRGAVDEEKRLHTGDLGYFDEEGDLFLAGRRSSMIKTGGERVFAERVEQAVQDHEAVSEVVVVGVPDETLGERIVAHVLLATSLADEAAAEECGLAIRQHARSSLPLAHSPREVHLWTEFPYKANGKVDREAVGNGTGGRRWKGKNSPTA